MGLYLCVFDGDEELEGVEVGMYADFNYFRTLVEERAGGGKRFPTLMTHSDCDGEWSPQEAALLERELIQIEQVFRTLPPEPFASDWQREVAKQFGLKPENLSDTLIDVDGEPLITRLLQLTRVSKEADRAILFQ